MEAYWAAGERLRHGQPLYVAVDPNADETIAYRYAPWFAWAWMPVTLLPKAGVQIVWSGVLVAASAASLVPLLRQRTWTAVALAVLLGGLLLRTVSTGNVHALVVAALVFGIGGRTGPLWIGLTASLKLVPLAFVVVEAARGRWRRAGIACAIAVILWAPAATYDLTNYPTAPGRSFSLLSLAGVVPWMLALIVALIITIWLGRTRLGWLAASVAAILAVPRLDFYHLTYLLAGASSNDTSRRRDSNIARGAASIERRFTELGR